MIVIVIVIVIVRARASTITDAIPKSCEGDIGRKGVATWKLYAFVAGSGYEHPPNEECSDDGNNDEADLGMQFSLSAWLLLLMLGRSVRVHVRVRVRVGDILVCWRWRW